MKTNQSAPSNPLVTLITGYRGLAENLIRTFSTKGHRVGVLVRRKEMVADLQERFPSVLFDVGDISKVSDVDRWFSHALETFGTVNSLINNAAIQGPAGRLHEISLEDFEETFRINFLSTVSLIQKVIPHFLEKKQGVVINLSGGGATAPRPRFSPYATAKAALVRLTDTLAMEYPELRFYALAPGGLRTNMTEAVVKMGAEKTGAEYELARKRWKEGGDDPQRAADLALWLCEQSPRHLNGRLISAIHDDYRELASSAPPEWWTLRRVDSLLAKKLREAE